MPEKFESAPQLVMDLTEEKLTETEKKSFIEILKAQVSSAYDFEITMQEEKLCVRVIFRGKNFYPPKRTAERISETVGKQNRSCLIFDPYIGEFRPPEEFQTSEEDLDERFTLEAKRIANKQRVEESVKGKDIRWPDRSKKD